MYEVAGVVYKSQYILPFLWSGVQISIYSPFSLGIQSYIDGVAAI